MFEGQNIEAEPQTPIPKAAESTPINMGANTEMSGEENVLINTGRFGIDPA